MFLKKDSVHSSLDPEAIKRTLIDHGYEYIRSLGSGGFAAVYLVRSQKYGCEFAVKVSVHENDFSVDKEKEIQTLIGLGNPNIIRMYEYFVDASYLYIILEYCPGGSLNDMLHSPGGSGTLKEPAIYVICRQITLALKACHDQHVAHRDIKPQNILVDQYGRPKLADFGLSDHFGQGAMAKSRAGSRAYMAPEVLRKSEYNPFTADIWSLGVTFYVLATGHFPWNMESQKEMELSINIGMIDFGQVKLDPEFQRIIRKMINVKAKQRASLEWILEQPVMAPRHLPVITTSQSFNQKRYLSSSPSLREGQFVQIPVSESCKASFGGKLAPIREDDKKENKLKLAACGSVAMFVGVDRLKQGQKTKHRPSIAKIETFVA